MGQTSNHIWGKISSKEDQDKYLPSTIESVCNETKRSCERHRKNIYNYIVNNLNSFGNTITHQEKVCKILRSLPIAR